MAGASCGIDTFITSCTDFVCHSVTCHRLARDRGVLDVMVISYPPPNLPACAVRARDISPRSLTAAMLSLLQAAVTSGLGENTFEVPLSPARLLEGSPLICVMTCPHSAWCIFASKQDVMRTASCFAGLVLSTPDMECM